MQQGILPIPIEKKHLYNIKDFQILQIHAKNVLVPSHSFDYTSENLNFPNL